MSADREVEAVEVGSQEGEAACEQESPLNASRKAQQRVEARQASTEAQQKAEAKEQKKESPAHPRRLTAGSRFELASANQDADVSSNP